MTHCRALIVEDEPPARKRLRALLDGVPWISTVGEAEDGRAALTVIDALKPDLVFLDIQLPEMTGLEVLEHASHVPAVIFTTAYDRYAVSAFELEALDYLVKPFGEQRLKLALDRAHRMLAVRDTSDTVSRARQAFAGGGPLTRILIRDRGHLTPVAVRDIERIEAEDDYVAVYATGRRYLVHLPLADFERRLDPEHFVRIHRTHLVNVDFIKQFTPYDGTRLQVEMRDGTTLLASRGRSQALKHLAL